jgi:hypothetical protein
LGARPVKFSLVLFFLEYARALRIISLRRSRAQQHSPETKKNKNKNRTGKKKKRRRQSKATRNYGEDLSLVLNK